MIICPSCRSQQMNGALFCSECGADLQAPAAPTWGLEEDDAPVNSTRAALSPVSPSPVSKTNVVSSPSVVNNKPKSVPQQPPARRKASSEPVRADLQVMVLNTGRIVDCPDKDNIIIGRSDAVTGDMPDIDLATDNALGLGVSRRHACITFRNDMPYLTDLGSLNRTWLNRQIMMRGQPYALKDGDEIRLGNAILKIILNSK